MRIESTFNILALSGGGIRGIYQATLLKNIEQDLYQGVPLNQMFDLVAGTSTGAIIAAAIAYGKRVAEIEELYKQEGNNIFKSRHGLKFALNHWYNSANLKQALVKNFGNTKISELKNNIFITSTNLDKYEHVTFTNKDNVSIVDAVMASTAAPFYFEPYQAENDNGKSYMDGGLWANNPALAAALYAMTELHIPRERIRILSIGTTTFPPGAFLKRFNKLQVFRPSKIKTVISSIFNASESSSEYYTRLMIPAGQFLHINEHTKEFIGLDDVSKALTGLPKLASDCYRKNKEKILDIIGNEGRKKCDFDRRDYITENAIINVGLSDFIVSRDEHKESKKYKDLNSFLSYAKYSIRIVSVSLHDAIQNHGLVSTLKKLLKENQNLEVTISLLNSTNMSLLTIMKDILEDGDEAQLQAQIEKSRVKLKDLTGNREIKNRVKLMFHNTIPYGTAIILDEEHERGKLFIETKPYKLTKQCSFSFELLNKEKPKIFANIVEGFKNIEAESTKRKTK